MSDSDAAFRARWRSAPRRRPKPIPPGPGQESVWDYPRPPRLEPVAGRVRVEFAGEVIAETKSALRVCETASPATYYVPEADVRSEWLEPSDSQSFCEWKGAARYWSIRVGARHAVNAAWSYPRPTAPFEALAGHFAFFAGRVDACYVGGERVTPQPGGFYGGWVTPNVVGPFKGEPGTEGW